MIVHKVLFFGFEEEQGLGVGGRVNVVVGSEDKEEEGICISR